MRRGGGGGGRDSTIFRYCRGKCIQGNSIFRTRVFRKVSLRCQISSVMRKPAILRTPRVRRAAIRPLPKKMFAICNRDRLS